MVEFARCTSEKTTIPVITWVFHKFGIPEEFKSDNGPPLTALKFRKYAQEEGFNPLTAEEALRALIDFTLSNARRFYSSMGNPLDGKGLTTAKCPH